MFKVIAHLWIPRFYSRAEAILRERPEDLPLVVINDRRVMDASLGARAKGIKPGTSLREARLACSDLIEVGYVPELYEDLAYRIWTACAGYSPAIEPLQQHEAFVDLTGCCPSVPGTLERVSRDIEGIIGIRPLFGVADSKLVSRIASGMVAQARPYLGLRTSCGRQVLRAGRCGVALTAPPGGKLVDKIIVTGKEKDFLSPLPVEVLWTLHEDTISRLMRLGIRIVGEIQAMSPSELVDMFGQAGYAIHKYSLGIDRSPVLPVFPKQAVTFRKAFDGGIADEMALALAVMEGASSIEQELKARAVAARKWDLVLEPVGANRVTYERRLAKRAEHHGGEQGIYQNLLRKALSRSLDAPVEAISLTATDLVPTATASQMDMFEPHEATERFHVVDEIASRVKDRFGSRSLFAASLLEDRRDRVLLAREALLV